MTTKSIRINTSELDVSNPADITIRFPEALKLGSLNWDVALLQVVCWYSVFNTVSQSIQYSHDSGSTWTTVSFPDGVYNIGAYNAALHAVMEANGHWDSTNKSHYITLFANEAIAKVYLEITSGTYQLRIPSNNMPTLLGMPAGDYTTSQYGANIPDINLGVELFVINCDLVDESYSNGRASQALFDITPNASPNGQINRFPQPEPIWMPVNKNTINSVRIWITDQQGRNLDFNGEHFTYTIGFRERR